MSFLVQSFIECTEVYSLSPCRKFQDYCVLEFQAIYPSC